MKISKKFIKKFKHRFYDESLFEDIKEFFYKFIAKKNEN